MRFLMCTLFFLCSLVLAGALVPPKAAGQAPPVSQLEGVWEGDIEAPGQQIGVVFHLDRGEDGALDATLDVPQQGATGIPVSEARASADSLRLEVTAIRAVFEGTLTAGGQRIEGTWQQGGGSFPLVLEKGATSEAKAPRRPQTPEPPFPYKSEDVRFAGGDDVTLAGTLTLPRSEAARDGLHPAVVLISGSGPQDRNGLVAGHETLHVLADYLTRRGVAVLRYDERGVGQSSGQYRAAGLRDFAADVRGGLDLLQKRDDIGKIGLIGWSEGGLIAPMIAARSPEVVDFLVLMGAPGVRGKKLLYEQARLSIEAKGGTPQQTARQRALQKRLFAALTQAPDSATAAGRFQAVLEEKGMSSAAAERRAQARTRPAFRDLLTYDPRPALRETNGPVLAIYGAKDLQVPPAQNAAPLREALAGHADATMRVLPSLNHLFQPAETGLPGEYARIETTIAPKALDAIAGWIARRTRADDA